MAGESPYWLACKNALIFIDIGGKRVHCFSPSSGTKENIEFNKVVGFAVPTSETTADGDIYLAVGLDDCIIEVNFTKKEITRILADPYADGMLEI